MHTVTFDEITAHAGEPVQITFTVTNQSGTAVSLAGAAATFKIARTENSAAIATKTESAGIVLSGNAAVVSFNTNELVSGASQLLGDFFAQLKITKSGDSLVAAEGRLHVKPVIQ